MLNSVDRSITAEEFFWEKNQKHAELIRGVLRVHEPPGGIHGYLAARISRLLDEHVHRHQLGTVFVETGYILSRGPDLVRAPDVSFVSAARLPLRQLPVAFIPVAPDLAVEIRSPDDAWPDIEEKLTDYFGAGVRLAWIVDPQERRIVVRHPDGTATSLGLDDVLDGGDAVPGFQCRLVEVFGR